MRRLMILAVFLFVFGLAGSLRAADVVIVVKGLRNTKGQVGVLLFDQSKGFPDKQDLAFKGQWMTPVIGELQTKFTGVPPGTYAVSVLHDENGNGKMDYNFVGVPKEGHGASGNPRPAFRAPRFDEAPFEVKEPLTTTEIKMIY